MRVLVLLALCAVASASFVDQLSPLDLSQPANNDALIEEINSRNDITWKAAANWAEDQTLGDVVNMLGGFIDPAEFEAIEEWESPEGYAAPDAFSWLEEMPECIGSIRDQARCGSCWAFAEIETLEDRFCIASKGEVNPELAPQDPVSCDKGNMGCRGGRLSSSWSYLAKKGAVTEACMPYTSGKGERGKCFTECPTGEKWEKFYAQKAKAPKGEDKMKGAISTEGPVEVAFLVYEDFIAYESGIYAHTKGKRLGGHAVEAIGYGEEGGVPYWLIANSWSTSWGENGYFRIIRGKNDCGIEKQVIAALPKL